MPQKRTSMRRSGCQRGHVCQYHTFGLQMYLHILITLGKCQFVDLVTHFTSKPLCSQFFHQFLKLFPPECADPLQLYVVFPAVSSKIFPIKFLRSFGRIQITSWCKRSFQPPKSPNMNSNATRVIAGRVAPAPPNMSRKSRS